MGTFRILRIAMTTRRLICLFVALLRDVVCLTEQEVSNFKHSGLNGGYVSITASSQRETYIISASGLPDHEIGNVNPNKPEDKKFSLEIPRKPEDSTMLGCLPKGPIGFTVSGVAIFNPLNAGLQNAVEGPGEETFDRCDGHADRLKVYHYHKLPDSCAYSSNTDEMVGVALDGFPIYGPHVSDLPRLLTPADLDRCNGRYVNGTYRYHATKQFPYFIGCFKGNADIAMNKFRKTIQYTCGSKSAYTEWGYLCSCSDPIALTPDAATTVTTDDSMHSNPLSMPTSPPPSNKPSGSPPPSTTGENSSLKPSRSPPPSTTGEDTSLKPSESPPPSTTGEDTSLKPSGSPPSTTGEDTSLKPSGSPPPSTTGNQFPTATCYSECDPSSSTRMECGALLLTIVVAVSNIIIKLSLS